MYAFQTDLLGRGNRRHTPLYALRVLAFLALCLGGMAPQARAQVQVLTHHNDTARTGANLNETLLNTTNVNIYGFGKLFSRILDGNVYAQPLYVSQVAIPRKGVHNVVYVATANNTVYAYDADDPAQTTPLWYRKFFNAVPGSLVGSPWMSTDGIIGTPVIATATNPATGTTTGTIYVVTLTLENNVQVYRLNALDITTGLPVYGSSVLIAATIPGTGDGASTVTFNAAQHLQRPALLLQNGAVYVAFGSHNDLAPYHGWIFGYNSQNLQAPPVVFNTTPNGGMGAFWQGGAGMAADANGNLYALVGNGDYTSGSTAQAGGNGYGEAFLKLTHSQGALSVADWFMPHDVDTLNAEDTDVGSGGPLLLPGTHLVVGGGKSGVIYLVDTTNMGHYNAADDNQIVQSFQGSGGLLDGGLVYWNSPNHGPQIYVWGGYDRGTAYQLVNGKFVTTPTTRTVNVLRSGYSNSPGVSLSANGSKSGTGILWATMSASGQASGVTVPGVLRAFDASNLAVELWNSNVNPTRDGGFNWAMWCPPTIANGKVYVATFSGELQVYGVLPSGTPTQPSIGVHFGGEVMGSGEIAGVNPQGNWNSPPKSNTNTGIAGKQSNLLDSSGNVTTATITWQADNYYALLSAPDLPGNFRMMWEYLDNTKGNPTTITVTNLPTSITAYGYDVYVYTNGLAGLVTPATYTLGNTSAIIYNTSFSAFDGIFIPADNGAAGNNSMGNYVLFANQTGSSFTVVGTPGTATDGSTHAPVNAIQVVARP